MTPVDPSPTVASFVAVLAVAAATPAEPTGSVAVRDRDMADDDGQWQHAHRDGATHHAPGVPATDRRSTELRRSPRLDGQLAVDQIGRVRIGGRREGPVRLVRAAGGGHRVALIFSIRSGIMLFQSLGDL